MELYIHIPFCVRKCNYCDFLSFPCSSEQGKLVSEYTDALCRETDAYKKRGYLKKVDTVFIGGGTPSVLSMKNTEKLLERLRGITDDKTEFTIECNPGTVDREKLKLFRDFRVNRLSFGLQSADDRELKRLGRIHTYEDFLRSYYDACEGGFDNISIDLMSAIPTQNIKSWINTLTKITALSPMHISAYSLIIEEGTPFGDIYEKDPERLELPDEDTEREMYRKTAEILALHGYNRYEISNYSKPGFESRHNLGYWTGEEYLGLGIGASSYIKNCENEYGVRFCNTSDITKYIKTEFNNDDVLRLHEKVEILTREDAISEYIFLHLRLTKGFSTKEFTTKFGADIRDLFADVIDKYKKGGFLEEKDGYIRLTETGLDVSNTIMSDFVILRD